MRENMGPGQPVRPAVCRDCGASIRADGTGHQLRQLDASHKARP
ncbi:hypothetical protein [Microbacterium sp.]|nr:hypothetical protein [Microbacterium sp.]|tara:strand:- start:12636 stop:12767 length:132 start_codon:yes stop_codon:yes gene_type:complete